MATTSCTPWPATTTPSRTPSQRRRLTNALVPAFKQKFFAGETFVQKGRALSWAPRDVTSPCTSATLTRRRAFAGAGFAGNLSRTRHDYFGVFSQNLNGSKSDYWQSREVTST